MKKKTLIITTGGSGGHVIPAGVLANELKGTYNILFFTDKRGLIYKKFIPTSCKIISIPCAALGGRGKMQKVFALAWTGLGILKALILFLYYRPAGVVGVGGYASFPACLIAGLLKKPVILHEQNTVLGKTNRMLARFATKIAISFKNTTRLPAHPKAIFTGLPLRKEITQKESSYSKTNGFLNILITGGSQGARALNAVAESFVLLPIELRKRLKITHQVVLKEAQNKIKEMYKNAQIKAIVEPFIEDMPKALSSSHLFIGASGAMILEVQYLRRPMILIPLRIAADNHQETNAREIEKLGGAKVVLDKDFNTKSFANLIYDLLSHPEELRKMQKALKPHNGSVLLAKLVTETI